jgi:hypothetical protein
MMLYVTAIAMTFHLQSTNIQLQGANYTLVQLEHTWNTSIILV